MDPDRYAEQAIREAIARGEFADVPGTGDPLPTLTNDPDWWVRAFLNREQLPERREDFERDCADRLSAAIEATTLTAARGILARVTKDIRRWNEAAPPTFRVEERSEIWLLDQRAQRPVR